MSAITSIRTPVERRLASGLAYAEWTGDGPPILALHGATSTRHFWSRLAGAAAGRRVIAPDLRGRGASMDMGEPYGLHQHVADLVGLLDELELRDVALVGHSLGAFVAPLLAQRSGGRIMSIVLVDGGIEVALPFFMTPALVRAIFRRQARRLARPVARDALIQRADWQAMLGAHPDELLEVRGWLEASAVATNGGVVAAVVPEALPTDSASCFFDAEVRAAARRPAAPTRLLYAQWGRGDRKRPFYAAPHVDSVVSRTPNLRAELVHGTNHVTILFAPELVRAVAGIGTQASS